MKAKDKDIESEISKECESIEFLIKDLENDIKDLKNIIIEIENTESELCDVLQSFTCF